MNKDEMPKKQKGISEKTNTYYSQKQTDLVKTIGFLGHLNPDIVFCVNSIIYELKITLSSSTMDF